MKYEEELEKSLHHCSHVCDQQHVVQQFTHWQNEVRRPLHPRFAQYYSLVPKKRGNYKMVAVADGFSVFLLIWGNYPDRNVVVMCLKTHFLHSLFNLLNTSSALGFWGLDFACLMKPDCRFKVLTLFLIYFYPPNTFVTWVNLVSYYLEDHN